jgi:hypothetical protein
MAATAAAHAAAQRQSGVYGCCCFSVNFCFRVCILSGVLSLQATHRYYYINYMYYSCCCFGCRDTTDWIRVDRAYL